MGQKKKSTRYNKNQISQSPISFWLFLNMYICTLTSSKTENINVNPDRLAVRGVNRSIYSVHILDIFEQNINHIWSAKIMLFIYLVWNAIFIFYMLACDNAVHDDISAKTVLIWLHHTVPTYRTPVQLKRIKVLQWELFHVQREREKKKPLLGNQNPIIPHKTQLPIKSAQVRHS